MTALLAALTLTLAGCSHAQTNNANGPRPCARHGSAFDRPCVTSSASASPSASASASASVPTSVPPSAMKPMGVAEPDLVAKSPAVQATELAAMKAMGITSVRLDADWGGVQYAGRTSFSWTALDQVVASVRAAGMTIDLIIDGCPAWAAKAGTSGLVSPPPASATQFATFAAAVAARYAPRGVTMFEIWNEPNNAGFWSPKPSAAAYTADLKAAYASIKRVDPAALVLSAGLAPEVNDGTNVNAITFLKSMYADGAKDSFDAVAYHPYSYPALPNSYQSWSGWSQMSQTNPSIRSIMISNGDAAKQVWITEVGAPTSGPDGVGQQGQANDLTQAIAMANATPWIAGLYLYSWQDEGTDPANDENWFGLLTAAGVRKAGYAAVATALGH